LNYFSQLVTFLILYTLSNSNYQKSLLFSIIIDLCNTNPNQCNDAELNKSILKYHKSLGTKNINSYPSNNKIPNHIKAVKTHFDSTSDIINFINKYQDNNNNNNRFNLDYYSSLATKKNNLNPSISQSIINKNNFLKPTNSSIFTSNHFNLDDFIDTYITNEHNLTPTTNGSNINTDNSITSTLNNSSNSTTINLNELEYSEDTYINNTTTYCSDHTNISNDTSDYSESAHISNNTLDYSNNTSPRNSNNISNSANTSNINKNTITNHNDNLNYPSNTSTNNSKGIINFDETTNKIKHNINETNPNKDISQDSDIIIKPNNNNNNNNNSSNDSTNILNINTYDKSLKHSNDTNSISNSKINDKIHDKYTKEKINSNKEHKYIITSSIKQLKESDTIKVSKFKNTDSKVNSSLHLPKSPFTMDKIPLLIGTCHINDIFKGSLDFSYPINNVIINSNEIIIKENYLLADNFMGMSSALFYFEGYLKTNFYTLETINSSKQMINSIYKDNIIYTPFTISKYLNIGCLLEDEKYLLKKSKLDITNFTYETTKELMKVNNFDKDSTSYNNCSITISLDYSLNIYSK